MNDCRDCANLKARIPISRHHDLRDKRILYESTTATCVQDLLMSTNGTRRVFKHHLYDPPDRPRKRLMVFLTAQRCHAFDSMVDDDEKRV